MNIFTSTATIMTPEITQKIATTLSDLLELVLLVVSTAVGWGVKLWISSMRSSWKQTIAKRLVAYAEQKIPTNDERVDYVAKRMHEKFPRLSEEEIHHHIEEAVVNLKTELGGKP